MHKDIRFVEKRRRENDIYKKKYEPIFLCVLCLQETSISIDITFVAAPQSKYKKKR